MSRPFWPNPNPCNLTDTGLEVPPMLERYLNTALIRPDLSATSRDDVIREVAAVIGGGCSGLSVDKIANSLKEREDIDSTGIEEGIAIPHAKVDGLAELTVAICRSKAGVDFGAHDNRPTRLFFVLLAPIGAAGEHMKVLARMAKVLSVPGLKEKLLEAKDAEEMYRAVIKAEKEL